MTAVAGTAAPAVAADFSNVYAMSDAGRAAAEKLHGVCQELEDAGAHATASRLRRMDRSAPELSYPSLERLVAPERAADEVAGILQQRVRRLGGWRNGLALLPLLVTWFALAWASVSYQRQLAQDPDKVTQPFLLLWEHRFGGGWIPPFSVFAAFDLVLLLIVLFLTARSHTLESQTEAVQTRIADKLDDAMTGLAVAVEQRPVRQPASAEEWAVTAQRTIEDAMRETKELAALNRTVLESAKDALDRVVERSTAIVQHALQEATDALKLVQDDGKQFVDQLAVQTKDLLSRLKEEQEQALRIALQEATAVVRQVGDDNRDMMVRQVSPLVDQIRQTMEDYRRDHAIYQQSAAELTGAVRQIGSAAGLLANSATSYDDTARSIDRHLVEIERSQGDFIRTVTESARSMGAAATAMGTISSELQGRMHEDLVKLTANVVAASEGLARVDRDLMTTSGSLTSASDALRGASGPLNAAAERLDKAFGRRRRQWWFFGRRGRAA